MTDETFAVSAKHSYKRIRMRVWILADQKVVFELFE